MNKPPDQKSKVSSDQAAPSGETSANNVPAPTTKEMVSHINTIFRKDVNGGKIKIGEYLIDNVFKGNIEEASSKNPKKDNSYSDIADSSDLEFSAKDLGICLRVAVLERVLKGSDENLCGLRFSVKREIIKLPETEQMLALARIANKDSLTVKQTREKVQAMMPTTATTDQDLVKKLINGLKSPLGLLSDANLKDVKELCSDKSRLTKDLNKKERTEIRDTAKSKLSEIEKCVTLLKGLTKILDQIDKD